MAREPERCERISIANATQLIRDAGYAEKADLLDDMLQDDEIEVDDELPRNTLGTARKVTWPFGRLSEEIALNPRRVLRKCTEMTRSAPRLITLAMTLHHEADHILCDDELAAFGEEITLARRLNADFDTLFPDLTPDQKREMEAEKHRMARGAEIQRRRIAGRGGRGYGRGHREEPSVVNKGVLSVRNQNTIKLEEVVLMTQERFYPSKPTSEVEITLARIGEAILLYEEQTGKLPNKLPDVCKVVGPEYPIRPNSKGDILDPWGAPIIYCVPGKIYVNRFDLYSRGECGVDHGGEEPNILYLLDRR